MLTIAKAVIGALVAGLGAAGTALLDNQIAPVEWIGIVTATLVALGSVWAVPNRQPDDVDRFIARQRKVRRTDLEQQVAPKLPTDD